ncbi:MAG: aldehyde dehydrogenase family protein [Thermoplasmatota archaeon]
MESIGMYIDGRWTETADGQFDTVNPTTGDTLARFPLGTAKDVERAIRAARDALQEWRHVPAPRRGEILLEAAHIMRRRKQELGELVTREMGKVISEGLGDVQESIDMIEYIAGEGRRMTGETVPSELPDKVCMTFRQPVGVVGLITPWNFPMAIPSWKLAPALLAGNTMLFKPSSLTPLCAARLVEIFETAGVPPGVLNLITGRGSVVGKTIVEHPQVTAISFTGGVPTGRTIYTGAAELLKPVHLELGGKNPLIIMDDAHLELAIEGTMFGAFGTAGQRCTAASRLILHQDVYDEAMDMLLRQTEAMQIGDPLDPDVDMGPMASQGQLEKTMEYIDIGSDEGATLAYGGDRLEGGMYDDGFFVQPAVFEAEQGMRVTEEEIFGPVLSVIAARDFDDAIGKANAVQYGLSSSIYTRDVTRAFRAIQQLEAGIAYVNAPTIGSEIHLPFGGVKNTGNGLREAGSAAIREFTETKTVFIDYSDRLQKAQIRDG